MYTVGKKKRAEHPDKLKRMQLEYSAGKMRAQLNEEALLCRNVTILSYIEGIRYSPSCKAGWFV